MRPDDLLGRRHPSRAAPDRATRSRGVVSTDCLELAAARREDAAGLADLVFLRRQRHRLVASCPGSRWSGGAIAARSENSSPSRASATASGLCTTCSPRLSALRRKMSPMLLPQTITISQADFFGDRLEAGRAHLARRADGEPVAGDEEGLAAVDARAEVGHQVAERSRLPALVERLEALRHAVGGRRDLIGVDGVELLLLARGPSDPRR